MPRPVRIVVIGVYGGEVMAPAELLSDREIELAEYTMYTLRRAGRHRHARRLEIPSDGVIGDVFPLDKAAEAFAAARSRQDRAKTIVEVRAGWGRRPPAAGRLRTGRWSGTIVSA